MEEGRFWLFVVHWNGVGSVGSSIIIIISSSCSSSSRCSSQWWESRHCLGVWVSQMVSLRYAGPGGRDRSLPLDRLESLKMASLLVDWMVIVERDSDIPFIPRRCEGSARQVFLQDSSGIQFIQHVVHGILYAHVCNGKSRRAQRLHSSSFSHGIDRPASPPERGRGGSGYGRCFRVGPRPAMTSAGDRPCSLAACLSSAEPHPRGAGRDIPGDRRRGVEVVRRQDHCQAQAQAQAQAHGGGACACA